MNLNVNQVGKSYLRFVHCKQILSHFLNYNTICDPIHYCTHNSYLQNPRLKALKLQFANHCRKQLPLHHFLHSCRSHSHHCDNNPQCFVHGPRTSSIRRKSVLEQGQNVSPSNNFWNENSQVVDRSHQPIKIMELWNFNVK